ncbi:MAG: hypothetical protein NT015_00850 [Alphaproteobacteria bacterium]|nr:hypothetical protein [Alphaproteobacteria bacterium]
MRTLLVASLLALMSIASAAAQEIRGPQAMLVGPEPDYRVSIGVAQGDGERATIRGRRKLAPDCTWVRVPDISVPMEAIVTLRDPAAVGGPERYGVLYATTYSALVAYQGGSPTPEYHGCVRQQMTQRAQGQ